MRGDRLVLNSKGVDRVILGNGYDTDDVRFTDKEKNVMIRVSGSPKIVRGRVGVNTEVHGSHRRK